MPVFRGSEPVAAVVPSLRLSVPLFHPLRSFCVLTARRRARGGQSAGRERNRLRRSAARHVVRRHLDHDGQRIESMV